MLLANVRLANPVDAVAVVVGNLNEIEVAVVTYADHLDGSIGRMLGRERSLPLLVRLAVVALHQIVEKLFCKCHGYLGMSPAPERAGNAFEGD